MLKIYRISQDENNNYDTYDAAIVAANNEDEARNIHPNGLIDASVEISSTWADPENVKVEYLGEAKEGTEVGVLLASFNAGF